MATRIHECRLGLRSSSKLQTHIPHPIKMTVKSPHNNTNNNLVGVGDNNEKNNNNNSANHSINSNHGTTKKR
eukprot:1411681-Amphidinium_carterae.1